MAGLPLHPKHAERVCWGCDRYCPAHDLTCGNGSERTPHPEEIFGPDWLEWAASNAIEVGGADPSEHMTEASRAEPAGEECRPFVSGQACRARKPA